MNNVDVFHRIPTVTLKSVLSALPLWRSALARLAPARKPSVRPLSEEWCRRHERDSAKR